eukprot:289133-Chlamydomonas_euryale.AAC.1
MRACKDGWGCLAWLHGAYRSGEQEWRTVGRHGCVKKQITKASDQLIAMPPGCTPGDSLTAGGSSPCRQTTWRQPPCRQTTWRQSTRRLEAVPRFMRMCQA